MSLSQILMIPGMHQSPIQEIKSLLFSGGARGGMWLPSLTGLSGLFTDTAGSTVATTFGQGVGRVVDLSSSANVATQSTGASKASTARHPVGGRRNLLIQTEDFTNAAWTKVATTAPQIDRITENSATSEHQLQTLASFSIVSGITYSLSGEFKAGERNRVRLGAGSAGQLPARAIFNLLDGTVVNTDAGGTASVDSLGDGWYRCKVSAACTSTTTTDIEINLVSTGTTTNYAGDNASGLFGRMVQFESGAAVTAYQKVTTTHDVTEVGKADVWHLSFDGTDDFLQAAAIDFSNSDKLTVFALVRKSSNHNGCIAETSVNFNSNNGSVIVFSNVGGTYSQNAKTNGGYAGHATAVTSAPSTALLTSSYDLAGTDLNTEQPFSRLNGVQDRTTATSPYGNATGNFGNFPLFIGRRGGVSLPFSGLVYGLIIVGGPILSISTIERVEAILQAINVGA